MEIACWNIFDNADLVVKSSKGQSIDEVVLFDCFLRIYYETKDRKILLFHDMPGSGFLDLQSYLSKLLETGNFYNPVYKNYDIGFLWNDSMREVSTFINRDIFYDIESYAVFSLGGKYTVTTWLYQNTEKAICFEVTPDYPWTFRDPEPHEKYIEYEEWMKHHYKPLIRRTMSREEVELWLQEVTKLYEQIKQNDERLRCRGEGCEMCVHEQAERK